MQMQTKVLFIGDPHFKHTNNEFTDAFIESALEVLKIGKYDFCVIAGDLLDTHEKLHQIPMDKCIKFIDKIRLITKLFILVGNHDYINNQQFLTDKHWMNSLKNWENVTICDKVQIYNNFVFVPYVPPGRFYDALNTVDQKWKNSQCIFAHQELRGCKLGIGVSEHGDLWDINNPLIISGHIHKNHKPQSNIIYPGSVIQHNFGEEGNQGGLLEIIFQNNKLIFEKNIPIDVPQLYTVEIEINEIEQFISNLKLKPLERIRIICKCSDQEIKNIKKMKFIKKIDNRIHLIFRPNNTFEKHEVRTIKSFNEIFNTKIEQFNLTSFIQKFNNSQTLEDLI